MRKSRGYGMNSAVPSSLGLVRGVAPIPVLGYFLLGGAWHRYRYSGTPCGVRGLRLGYSCSDLSGNSLDGAIHPSIGELVNLVSMYRRPLCSTAALVATRIAAQLVHTMTPEEYRSDPLMFRCSLFQENRFVGTIPNSIAFLPAVTKIDFENNTLTGAVPAAFWANPSLTSLYAEHLRAAQRSLTWRTGTHTRACTHAHTHAPACRRRRSLKGNRLTSLDVPDKNGTCCATTIHIGPTQGPGQPMYQAADGLSYYFANKSIPIGSITACAADAANPGQRTNTDPDGEERFTFTLSVERASDGDVSLTTKAIEAWPSLYYRRQQHQPARLLRARCWLCRITSVCICVCMYV
jgi:hypothetical protein